MEIKERKAIIMREKERKGERVEESERVRERELRYIFTYTMYRESNLKFSRTKPSSSECNRVTGNESSIFIDRTLSLSSQIN